MKKTTKGTNLSMANAEFRLIALYVGNYALFHNQVFNFCSDYVVEKVKGPGCTLNVKHKRKLPRNFFSIANNANCNCVNSVSAVIANNGGGKTTVARLLAALPAEDEDRKNWNVVVLCEVAGKIEGYTTIQGDRVRVLEGESKKCVDVKCILEDWTSLPYKLFYYSPYFTTEQPYWDIADEGKMVRNISTTWLMFHPEGNSETLRGEKVKVRDRDRKADHYDNVVDGKPKDPKDSQNLVNGNSKYRIVSDGQIFGIDEKIRVFEFVSAYYETIKEDRDRARELKTLEIPTPSNIAISIYSEGVEQADRKIAEILQTNRPDDKRMRFLRTVRGALTELQNNTDFLVRVFCAFVVRYVQECGVLEPRLTEPYFFDDSFLIELSYVLRKLTEIGSGDNMNGKRIIVDFLKTNVPPSSEGGMDSTNKTCAVELFECLGALLRMKGPDAKSPRVKVAWDGVLRCRLGDKEVLQCVCRLVRLHGLTKIFSPFLKFDIFPQMSSGEMSFLSMFARLYRFICAGSEKDDNIVLFMDEAETTLHPEWQRRLVDYCIRFLEVFFPERHFQVLFASHSPMLLSDIPAGNCCFLKSITKVGKDGSRGKVSVCNRMEDFLGEKNSNTFGANIYDLYRYGFFLKDGAIGEFSARKIKAILEDVSKRSQGKMKSNAYEDFELSTDLLGDRILSRYVQKLKERSLI